MKKVNDIPKSIITEKLAMLLNAFMPISEIELQELLSYCEYRHFDKGAIITHEGETEQYMNIVALTAGGEHAGFTTVVGKRYLYMNAEMGEPALAERMSLPE